MKNQTLKRTSLQLWQLSIFFRVWKNATHLERCLRRLSAQWHGGDLTDGSCCVVQVPVEIRHRCERGLHSLRCLPPHELLHAEIVPQALAKTLEETTRPTNYSSRPIVQDGSRRGLPTVPLAMHIDGVRVGRANRVLGCDCAGLAHQQTFFWLPLWGNPASLWLRLPRLVHIIWALSVFIVELALLERWCVSVQVSILDF